MLGKREVKETGKPKEITRYRFHVNDPVLCTIKDCNIDNAIILNRYNINGDILYKIGNSENTKMCKEGELLHR